MSVDITQAVITGSELPAGDLVAIFRYPDDATGVWWVYKPVTDGSGISPAFHRKPFYAMPPTANDGIYVDSSTSYFDTILGGVEPKDITKIYMTGFVTVFQCSKYSGGITTTHPTVFVKQFGVESNLDGSVSKICATGDSYTRYVTVLAGGTTEANVARNAVHFRVNWAQLPKWVVGTLDFSKCTISGNEVVIQGIAAPNLTGTTADKIYVLLTSAGMCAVFDAHNMLTTNSTTATTSYVQLNIPVGGEIKYFGRQGYYIAEDASNDLFLYSIANNGTLITQLNPGSFDITKHIELFEFL